MIIGAVIEITAILVAFVLAIFRFTPDNPIEMIMTTTGFAGAGISLIMIIAKYKDKATRNSDMK